MNLQIQLKKKDDTKYFDTTTISPISNVAPQQIRTIAGSDGVLQYLQKQPAKLNRHKRKRTKRNTEHRTTQEEEAQKK